MKHVQEASKTSQDRFLLPTWTSGTSKSLKLYKENKGFQLLRNFSIRSMMYQTLMPTWLHFGVTFPPRRLQDAFKTPQDAPAWCPRKPRSRPRGAQDAPRTAQELPQRRPGSGLQAHWREDTPQSSPRLPQDLDFGPFCRRFGRIWDHLGWILGRILEGF